MNDREMIMYTAGGSSVGLLLYICNYLVIYVLFPFLPFVLPFVTRGGLRVQYAKLLAYPRANIISKQGQLLHPSRNKPKTKSYNHFKEDQLHRSHHQLCAHDVSSSPTFN